MQVGDHEELVAEAALSLREQPQANCVYHASETQADCKKLDAYFFNAQRCDQKAETKEVALYFKESHGVRSNSCPLFFIHISQTIKYHLVLGEVLVMSCVQTHFGVI